MEANAIISRLAGQRKKCQNSTANRDAGTLSMRDTCLRRMPMQQRPAMSVKLSAANTTAAVLLE